MPPKLNRTWTYDLENKMIDFYEEHEVLWRPSASGHHKAKNSSLMDQLVVLLDSLFTVEDIHKRFSALRSTFRENNKKVQARKSGSSGDAVYRPTFLHYNRLMFLADTFYLRSSQSTLGGSSVQAQCAGEEAQSESGDWQNITVLSGDHSYVEDDEDNELYAFNTSGFAEKLSPPPVIVTAQRSSTSTSPFVPVNKNIQRPASNSSSSSSSPVPAKKAKPADEANNALLDLARQRLAQPRQQQEKDENTLFGAYVGANLNKLTDLNAASARIAIDQALFLYRSDNPKNPNN